MIKEFKNDDELIAWYTAWGLPQPPGLFNGLILKFLNAAIEAGAIEIKAAPEA